MSATQAQPNGHPSPAASSHTQTAATASTSALPRLHYGGYDRFELELEFVQMLSNPLYLQHLASQKILDSDDLLAYVDYLQYFRRPEYLPYLQSVPFHPPFLPCFLPPSSSFSLLPLFFVLSLFPSPGFCFARAKERERERERERESPTD
ncbi:SOH1-domain-containing protein [Dissoconium aciculare CBS 342.82]|uniref:Mediator of RNA polymerase II transcription subunit 31 n=1 Tax=Dissoconium aciculare CBS 342.82 TaxID=1314786 RepID=A0A6J3M5T9_9PEZI|nr:SOH1-domain-containing protein [Dissoconium aciculare CBS 342.82]KAF1823410.1 SOH1-domain-containing protein [Dissoconium aciculare CBS 342.82]